MLVFNSLRDWTVACKGRVDPPPHILNANTSLPPFFEAGFFFLLIVMLNRRLSQSGGRRRANKSSCCNYGSNPRGLGGRDAESASQMFEFKLPPHRTSQTGNFWMHIRQFETYFWYIFLLVKALRSKLCMV